MRDVLYFACVWTVVPKYYILCIFRICGIMWRALETLYFTCISKVCERWCRRRYVLRVFRRFVRGGAGDRIIYVYFELHHFTPMGVGGGGGGGSPIGGNRVAWVIF